MVVGSSPTGTTKAIVVKILYLTVAIVCTLLLIHLTEHYRTPKTGVYGVMGGNGITDTVEIIHYGSEFIVVEPTQTHLFKHVTDNTWVTGVSRVDVHNVRDMVVLKFYGGQEIHYKVISLQP